LELSFEAKREELRAERRGGDPLPEGDETGGVLLLRRIDLAKLLSDSLDFGAPTGG